VQRHAGSAAIFGYVFVGAQRQQFGCVRANPRENGGVIKLKMDNGEDSGYSDRCRIGFALFPVLNAN
jgi:hypothetical protein